MAERILDVLGQMKGAAMKIGQVASFVDPELAARVMRGSRRSSPCCAT